MIRYYILLILSILFTINLPASTSIKNVVIIGKPFYEFDIIDSFDTPPEFWRNTTNERCRFINKKITNKDDLLLLQKGISNLLPQTSKSEYVKKNYYIARLVLHITYYDKKQEKVSIGKDGVIIYKEMMCLKSEYLLKVVYYFCRKYLPCHEFEYLYR